MTRRKNESKGRRNDTRIHRPAQPFHTDGLLVLQADLNGLTDINQIASKIKEFINENNIKAGEWVIARGYDNNLFEGKQNPSLCELDDAVPDNPLVIQHKSGHMGLFNSKALKALGVTESTECPQGGKIEIKGGKLTGYMEENAFFEYLKKHPSRQRTK